MSRLRLTSSFSKWFNSEWGASLPFLGGSSMTTSFPFRLEEPSPFTNDMKNGLSSEGSGQENMQKARQRRGCEKKGELRGVL